MSTKKEGKKVTLFLDERILQEARIQAIKENVSLSNLTEKALLDHVQNAFKKNAS